MKKSINFYQVKKTHVYNALFYLVRKSIEQNKRVLIQTRSIEMTKEIDEFLWSYDLSSFVPHNKLGDEDTSFSPIFITNEQNDVKDYQYLFIMSNFKYSIAEICKFERTFVLFNNNDTEFLKATRTLWTDLDNFDGERRFWVEEQNGWKLNTYK